MTLFYKDYSGQLSSPLPGEVAVSLSYNGISHAVMVASENDLEDFALGFSLSEGLVSYPEHIYSINQTRTDLGFVMEMEIAQRDFQKLKTQRRSLQGRSGCGLCGHESLESTLTPLELLPGAELPPAEHFQDIRQRIRDWQPLGEGSGALHAAALLNASGEISLCREDIGRHNALDKLLGAAIKESADLSCRTIVMTSRCSIELVRKAIRCRLATLVTLAAPSSLSVTTARQHRLNLIHISRQGEARLYSKEPAENREPLSTILG
ncbi:formate dehydrogenase accessory sulfurtransferase FdhD [Endozoicomonas arenosclerae]|uniref:formate dehydrogenase accessory sulfurtransferase FdhD n=1 Tax=Endozoicomonas arenosclerae TaxID=1633495 RepID=UPI000780C5E1|nr:formate dehydrogenase accessory sulfurtransferase FdhD [Endozoicomonas arenosclerae]